MWWRTEGVWEGVWTLLVSRLMGNSKGQTKASVLIYGTASVFATHPTDWSKTWEKQTNRSHHQRVQNLGQLNQSRAVTPIGFVTNLSSYWHRVFSVVCFISPIHAYIMKHVLLGLGNTDIIIPQTGVTANDSENSWGCVSCEANLFGSNCILVYVVLLLLSRCDS